MHSTPRKRWGLLGALIAGMVFMTTSAVAQHAAHSNANANKEEVAVAPNGQQVAIDAKSGKLRQPTREEVEALIEGMKPALDTSTEGLKPVQHEDGTVSVDLEGRFQSTTIAKVQTDGTVSQRCVKSTEEAKEFLMAPAKKVTKKKQAAPTPQAKPVWEEK